MPPKLIFAGDKLYNITTQCPFSPPLSLWHSRIDTWPKCPWRDISVHCQWYGEARREAEKTKNYQGAHDPGIDGSYKSHAVSADT